MAGGHQLRHRPAGARDRLEAAGAPACVDEAVLDRGFRDQRRAVAGHVHDTAPLAQHFQAADHREGFDQRTHGFLDVVEAAALGVVVEPVGAAADHHLALVGLGHVAVHGVGHHNHVHAGFDRLGHHRLQRHGFHRQTEARHFRQNRGVAGHDHAQLVAINRALGGVDAHGAAVLGAHTGDFALLDDVHAHVGARTGIAPGHSIVAGGAAALLPQAAQHRVAGAVQVDDRHQLLDAFRSDPLGLHTLLLVGMRGALVAADLMLGLGQHDHAARAEHHVVVQVLRHGLIQAARLFIDRSRRILQVVRADDGGVPARIAATQPAFLDNCDIGNAEILAQVIGGGEAVPARTNDDDIVMALGFRRAPGALPSGVIAQGFPRDSKD